MKYKLSIIIPAYNVDKYIEDCLDSVLSQIDENVEVIVVNDGSTDDTLNIINKKYHDKIKLIDQENKGLSAARNAGILESNSDYVAFLDSDDVWSPDFYQCVKKYFGFVDVIEFNAFSFSENGNQPIFITSDDSDVIKEIDSERLFDIFKLNKWFCWSRIFKTSIVKQFYFPDGRRYEDIATVPLFYLKSKTIVCINKELVGYRVNQNSITHNPTIKDIYDVMFAVNVVKSKCETKHQLLVWSVSEVKTGQFLKFLFMKVKSKNKEDYDFFFNSISLIKRDINAKYIFKYDKKALLTILFMSLSILVSKFRKIL